MTRWRFAGVLVLVSSLMVSAQKLRQDEQAERSKLIAFENAWNQAQIHRDGEALNLLMGDRYIFTKWDGTLMNKATFIADNKDPTVQTDVLANEGVDVYFYPGVAVVTGIYHFKGTNRGKSFDHYGRFTDTWISSGGQWVCVAPHASLGKKPVSP